MKRIRLWFLFLSILLCVGVTTVPSAKADANVQTPIETSSEALTADNVASFVDSYVAEMMAAAHAPGLVVTIVYQGEIILSRGYGVADAETGRPMTAETNLRAGSLSKPVTSAAVLQMVAAGSIALDAPVSDYLPHLPLQDGYGQAGTIADLLTLKGGYADVVVQTHAPTLADWQPLHDYLRENIPPRVLPPGKVHSYNSWEHALLGQVMAELQDKPFDQVMAHSLFQPLGMSQTTFTQPLPDSIAANMASGHAYVRGRYEEVPLDYVNLSPGIALVTTGADMGRFMLALLDDGVLDGERVLATTTVAGMLNRQQEVHPLSRGRTFGFSELTLGDHLLLYQDGNGIGHGNRMLLSPQDELGIFLSVNHRPLAHDASSTPAFTFLKELSHALLENFLPSSNQEKTPFPPLPAAAARARRYTGHYHLAGTPPQDFFKLGALLDNVDVRDNGDGTVSIGANRYVEVEPLLFQSQSDPGFFVVFIEDDNGEVGWLTFGGTGSYQKVRWYESPASQLALVGIMLLGFLAFVVLIPFSRHHHWPLWLLSLLGLIFLLGLAMMMTRADLLLFFKTIPLATTMLFLIPWLNGALALTFPLALAALRRNRPPAGVWILYALNIAATAAFFWFASYWNLYLR